MPVRRGRSLTTSTRTEKVRVVGETIAASETSSSSVSTQPMRRQLCGDADAEHHLEGVTRPPRAAPTRSAGRRFTRLSALLVPRVEEDLVSLYGAHRPAGCLLDLGPQVGSFGIA